MTDPNKDAVIKWLPLAEVVRENARGSRGFRYHIETQELRLSSQHRRVADAWKEAFDRVIGSERCEHCRKPVHLVYSPGREIRNWVHADETRICFNDPLDGVAEPADADVLAKFADEDVSELEFRQINA